MPIDVCVFGDPRGKLVPSFAGKAKARARGGNGQVAYHGDLIFVSGDLLKKRVQKNGFVWG